MAAPMTPRPALQPARLQSHYQHYVNPQWVSLLNLLGLHVEYDRCVDCELFSADGRRILDFLSGYCVHNIGHNHPAVIASLKQEMDKSGPCMLQSHVPEIAGELAARLCQLAGGELQKVYFGSSGSEAVEAAIKFARAATNRDAILYATHSFHGLTTGALSLMDDGFWRGGFGPLLPETHSVPYADLPALQSAIQSKRFAAFIVEPVQAEAGIQVPTQEYLHGAQEACRRAGTLFILDEVQTGMFRTGTFLAAHQFQVFPDIVLLAKALSGGFMPVSAVLMTDRIYKAVYSSLKRSIVHTSTFSENSLSMRAGLATLDVLQEQNLGARAMQLGEQFRADLRGALSRFEMVKEVRGMGLLCGIEFAPPKRLAVRALYEAFARVHPAMFGQVLMMRMFREKNILTQICGNNFMVLKAAPPLTVRREFLSDFVAALRDLVELAETSSAFWSEALSMARRAVNV